MATDYDSKTHRAAKGFEHIANSYRDAQQLFNMQPALGSPAVVLREFGILDTENVDAIYAVAAFQLDAAIDCFAAAASLILDGTSNVAPWASLRVGLECSAESSWVLNEHVCGPCRLGRGMSLRIDQQSEYEKLVRRFEEGSDDARWAAQELERLRAIALAHDFSTAKPARTELTTKFMGVEAVYRILAAISHGNRSLTIGAAYTEDRETGSFTPRLNSVHALMVVNQAVIWLAASCCSAAWSFGWERPVFETIVDEVLADLNLSPSLYPWRAGTDEYARFASAMGCEHSTK